MKNSKLNIIIITSLVLILCPVHAYSEPSDQPVSVIAENGQFTPKDITVAHLSNYPVTIYAKDNDYEFILTKSGEKIGKTHTIKKGAHYEIFLGENGDGKYEYSCGAGCSGTVTVSVAVDIE